MLRCSDFTAEVGKKHIKLGYKFDGSRERIEKWQYPMEAIREIVLNAIIHRNYQNPTDTIIKIFDDQIHFTNPGKLFENITLDSLKNNNNYISSHRNKLLTDVFFNRRYRKIWDRLYSYQ